MCMRIYNIQYRPPPNILKSVNQFCLRNIYWRGKPFEHLTFCVYISVSPCQSTPPLAFLKSFPTKKARVSQTEISGRQPNRSIRTWYWHGIPRKKTRFWVWKPWRETPLWWWYKQQRHGLRCKSLGWYHGGDDPGWRVRQGSHEDKKLLVLEFFQGVNAPSRNGRCQWKIVLDFSRCIQIVEFFWSSMLMSICWRWIFSGMDPCIYPTHCMVSFLVDSPGHRWYDGRWKCRVLRWRRCGREREHARNIQANT